MSKIENVDFSDLESLNDDSLLEIRDEFYEKEEQSLPFSLSDFEEVVIELERRTGC